MLDSTALVAISAAVLLAVQLLKWGGVPRAWAIYLTSACSALGVGIYAYSQLYDPWTRLNVWPLVSAWLIVLAASAGTYGFVRDQPAAETVKDAVDTAVDTLSEANAAPDIIAPPDIAAAPLEKPVRVVKPSAKAVS